MSPATEQLFSGTKTPGFLDSSCTLATHSAEWLWTSHNFSGSWCPIKKRMVPALPSSQRWEAYRRGPAHLAWHTW